MFVHFHQKYVVYNAYIIINKKLLLFKSFSQFLSGFSVKSLIHTYHSYTKMTHFRWASSSKWMKHFFSTSTDSAVSPALLISDIPQWNFTYYYCYWFYTVAFLEWKNPENIMNNIFRFTSEQKKNREEIEQTLHSQWMVQSKLNNKLKRKWKQFSLHRLYNAYSPNYHYNH